MNYRQKLRLPQWQKRRLHLLERAGWRCAICGSNERELHVHHIEYDAGKEPWDYPDSNFLVLCRLCHEQRIHNEGALYRDLPDVGGYPVIRFHHIDDYRCLQPLRRFCEGVLLLEEPSEQFLDLLVVEMRRRLGQLFKENGWEGDGEPACTFVPPCFVLDGYSCCETVFHVKQQNNGTSFIALPPGFQLQLAEDFFA